MLSGLLFSGMLIISGCDALIEIPSVPPTESAVLDSFVKDGVQPNLNRVAETAGRLDAAVRGLCTTPTAETLQQAQSAWRAAYLAWRRAGPFLFGPAGKLERTIGTWPVNTVVLDAAVQSPDLADLLKNTDVRGYAAAEHLLFAPASADAATTAGRCAHLQDVTEEIARLTADAKRQWENEFAGQFISAGDGNPFLTPSAALSMAVTETLNVTERTLRDRISIPSGYFRTAIKPENLEAWRSGNTAAGFQATLDGICQAVSGGEDSSFAALVATKDGLVEKANPALAADLIKQMDRIGKTIAGLNDVKVTLQRNPTELKPLYQQFQALQDQLVEASLVLELDVYKGVQQADPLN